MTPDFRTTLSATWPSSDLLLRRRRRRRWICPAERKISEFGWQKQKKK
jgi:hypothetical protein